MTWSEEEYVDCLQGERRCYAWVMQRYGGLTPHQAWAMLALYGDRYPVEHPELIQPSAEYRALG